jgi:hypothetical protein
MARESKMTTSASISTYGTGGRKFGNLGEVSKALRPADIHDVFYKVDVELAQRKPRAQRPARGILGARIQ